jgi:hypothetical protein
MGLCYFVNGMANNAIIPIAHKIATVYDLSSTYINAPISASFLVYSFSNFPANFIIDTMGLRKSFILGTGLYTAGILLFTLINKGYFFVIIGAILVALGQPFIVNCPAKVATFWFLSKNVSLCYKKEDFGHFNNDWYQPCQCWHYFHAANNFCFRVKWWRKRKGPNILPFRFLFSRLRCRICPSFYLYAC